MKYKNYYECWIASWKDIEYLKSSWLWLLFILLLWGILIFLQSWRGLAVSVTAFLVSYSFDYDN